MHFQSDLFDGGFRLKWGFMVGVPPEAGKTTLGRGVAEILGFDFDDLDEAWTWRRLWPHNFVFSAV